MHENGEIYLCKLWRKRAWLYRAQGLVSLVVEKEPERKGLGRSKGSKNRAVSRTRTGAAGEAMEVDSSAPTPTMPAKRPR